MSYEYITKYDAVSYTAGRQGNSIDKIIIHHWGSDGQTFESVCNWFQNAACSTSAHYVVEGGRVACLVDLSNTAYHAGDWNANLTSIGIECRPEMSADDLETACELVAYLFGVYGVLPVYGHKDFSSTACPGRYYGQLNYIKKRAQEIMGEGSDEEMAQFTDDELKDIKSMLADYRASKNETVPDWAKDEYQAAINEGITTGENPNRHAKRLEVACMIHRAINK